MKLSFKDNSLGYFSFYYRILGNKFFVYLSLSIVISVLDGVGLAMFIPLLQFVSGGASSADGQSLGQLHFVLTFITSMGFQLNVNTVLVFICILFVLKGFMKYVHVAYNAKIRHLLIKKVRIQLLENVQDISFTSFLKLDAGKIQNTLTNEVTRLALTMAYYFSAAQSSVMLCTYIVLAFLANYQFAVLVAVGAALSNLIYRKIYKYIKDASVEVSSKGSDFNGYLIQAVHYFKYLKSTNTFKSYSVKLREVITDTENLNRKIGTLKALGISIKEPVIVVIVSLVIFVQINVIGTNLGTIILSLLLFYRALSFLVSTQTDYQSFIENIGAMHTIAKMSDTMSDMKEPEGSVQVNEIKKQLRFNNVVFNYDTKVALDNINLTIPAKQTIALVGESGSGKTTLANMICGLIKPLHGEMLIDDLPLEKANLHSYRNKIGYISQESVVFNDTVYNNITFWAEPTEANVARFNKILHLASLYDFVQTMPLKEHTNLGDNGILISGGQKQRISIARELFKDVEILIFDEATSALDSETEKIIQENIEKLHGSYTMILIAHRLSTIKDADTICLMEEGRIIASGSFKEMMQSSTRFKKMVSLQMV